MESHGIKPIHQILKVEQRMADERTSELLDLRGDNRVVYIQSVKKVEDEPVLIESSYLSYREFGRLISMDINGPFYNLLIEEFNVRLHYSTQVFSAVLSGSEESRIFGFKESQPCIMLESIVFDQYDIPIELLYSHYRGDRYRFKVTSGEYMYG